MGEQEERCGWKSSCYVCVCWEVVSALNREPQLRFHNDITGEMAESSAGETEVETPPTFQKGGACHQLLKFIHIPWKDTVVWEQECLVSSHSVSRLRHKEWKAVGSSGHKDRHS